MKAIRVFALATLMLMLSASAAEGCTCGYPSPAEAFGGATAVFVGRVVRVEEHEAGQTVVALVEESFKGARVGGELVFTQPNNTCTPTFDAGERRLFYANYVKKTKTWTVYGCGRTAELERAADDLMYLRALPLSAERNRVSGMLRHYEDGPESGFTLVGRVAGARVRIKGKDKTYEVTTDSNGVYELYDLPPGRYTIEPELPFGLKVRFAMQFGPDVDSPGGVPAATVQLTEKTCAGADFILSSDNFIGGRVFGPGGAPLPGVCLELLAAGKVESPGGGGRIFDCADAEGRYKLDTIPPGRYFLVVNGWDKITGNTPFPMVYYPGTFEKEKASVVAVGPGDSREGYDVTVPSLFQTVTLSGVLQYSDGRPVADEPVSFKVNSSDERYAGADTRTDEAGRFSFKAVRGVPGTLVSGFLAYEGRFEKVCPEIKRLLAKGADKFGGVLVEARPVAVSADEDTSDLRLVLPVPYCPPKKTEGEKKEDDEQ